MQGQEEEKAEEEMEEEYARKVSMGEMEDVCACLLVDLHVLVLFLLLLLFSLQEEAVKGRQFHPLFFTISLLSMLTHAHAHTHLRTSLSLPLTPSN